MDIPKEAIAPSVENDAAQTKRGSSIESWWMVALLLLFYILATLDRNIFTMIVDPIKKDLLLSDFEMSLLLGPGLSLFFAIAGFPLGMAADRYPRRWIIFLGVIFASAATILGGLGRSFMSLLMSRMLVGGGEAALTPSAYSLIADKFPRERLTTVLAVYGMGPKLGLATAFAAGAVIISFTERLGSYALPVVGVLHPWQLTLMIVGLPGLLLSALVFTFSEPRRSAGRGTQEGTALDLLPFLASHRKLFTLIVIGFGLVALCTGALMAWIPTYMSREFGWSAGRYGPILSLISLLNGLIIVPKGMLVDWLFSRGMKDAHVRFYTWLLAFAVPVLSLAFMMKEPVHFLILYGMINVVTLTLFIYVSALLQVITPPNLRGRATALLLLLLNLFVGMLGPVCVAILTDFFVQGSGPNRKSALDRFGRIARGRFHCAALLAEWRKGCRKGRGA